MNENLTHKIVAYRQSVSIVKSMLIQGIISENEYTEIERILAQKYGLSSFTIFR